MASAKQVAANRQNALKSTGPRNTQNVRFNALRHGLRASILILSDEKAEAFNRLLEDLETEWQPRTPTEFIQVERMAVNYWKLARADRREAFFRLNDMPDRFVDQSFKFQQGFERAFDRAQQSLERLQTNRCAAPADSPAPSPAPVAIEPPAVEPIEVQLRRPDEPAEAPANGATPFPPDLPPYKRRYLRRQAAADEKREKQLMRDGLLRPADYRYYPRNPLMPKAKTPSTPESPTVQVIHTMDDPQE
ncbi:MAG TPA: hypothetical protein VH640_06335 [Bryobacteraceae bacterium]|jgi:hypothetical protein